MSVTKGLGIFATSLRGDATYKHLNQCIVLKFSNINVIEKALINDIVKENIFSREVLHFILTQTIG
jgi:hypothetical protein